MAKITMSDGGYPIGSQSDAESAWKLRRHSKNHSEDEVKAHISRAVNKLGLKHPAANEKSAVDPRFTGEELRERRRRGGVLTLPDAQLARLRELYGLPAESAVKEPKPHPAADAEQEIIKKNKLHPQASKPHPFSKSTKPINGAHRCLMCGQTEPDNNTGQCNVTDINGTMTPRLPQRPSVPVMAKLDDQEDAAECAQGIDAGIDQAIVLLESARTLPEEGQQALQLLYGIEEAADNLLDWFGVADADVNDQEVKQVKAQQGYAVTSLTERVPPPAVSQPNWAPDHPAFVTEMNGKTLITAQATVDPALFEKAFTPNDFYLWTQGRLVGADEANRNGAFWTSGDLELGQATVRHGPLNWLHEGKHVIGTLAEAAFTSPTKEQADAGFTQPHIAVVGPVWRWIYPDEAEVIQMASEANKFWYSMECISKSVQCVGEGSCGAEAAYLDYIQGKGSTCRHMTERSATRRFADPTFLGAAVIVPPVRPGWADANAGVMTKAAEIAEKSFDQAGRPDVSATEWEQLMAQVVRFATA